MLYKEVLDRAHVQEFGSIGGEWRRGADGRRGHGLWFRGMGRGGWDRVALWVTQGREGAVLLC